MIRKLQWYIPVVILLLSKTAFGQISVDSASGCSPHLCSFSLNQSYLSYSWQFSDGSQSSAASPFIIFDDAGSYSVTVTVTSSSGSQTFTESNIVDVFASPDPSISIVTDTVCLGEPIQASIVQPTSASSYQWVLGDGSSYTTNQISHMYQTHGTYSLQLNETNIGGCSASSDVSLVQVRSQPNPSFSLSEIKACHDSVVITATASNQNNNIQWKLNGSPYATGGSSTFSALQTGYHDITLVTTDAYGCENEHTRTIKKSNPPSFSSWNSGLQGCAPYAFELGLSSAYGASVTWEFGGSSYSGDSATIMFNQAGDFSVIESITDSLNCSYSDTISGIDVQQTTMPDVTLGDTILCAHDRAHFSVDDTSVMSVTWSIADSSLSAMTDSIAINVAGWYDLNISFNLTNGCTIQQSIDDAFLVESAAPMISLEDEEVCVSTVFETRHNNPYISSPSWSLAGQTRTGDTTHFTVDSVGTFDLQYMATTTNGCSDTTVFAEILTVKGDSLVSGVTNTYSTCDPLLLNFNGGDYGVDHFSWDFGDGAISTDSLVSHSYHAVGTYVVSLEAVNMQGCTLTLDSHSVIEYGDITPDYGFELVNCVNAEVLFYSLTEGSSWIWEIDGDTFTDSSFTTPVDPYAPVNVKHIVTNDEGCSGMLLDVNALYLDSCVTVYTGDFPAPGQTGGSGNWYMGQPYVSACAPVSVGFDHPEDSLDLVIYDFGNGDTAHAYSKINYTFDTAGTYDIHLSMIHVNGDTNFRLLEDYVRIGGPEAEFSLEENQGCYGTQVNMTNTSVKATIWNTTFGDGGSSNLMHPSHTYTTAGDFNVLLVAKDTFNCISTAVQQIKVLSNDYTLEVPSHVCAGDTFYMQHDVTGYDEYTWHIGTHTFTGRNPAMVIPTGGSFAISLEAIDTNGCSTVYFDDQNITIFGPEVGFNLGIDADQCFSVDHMISAISTNAPNLSWYVNGEFLANQQDFEFHADTAGAYMIELLGWQNGCQAAASDTVTVHEPVADFNINNAGLCLPQTVPFNDLSSPAVSWQWDFGDGGTSTLQNPSHAFQFGEKDSIELSITDSFGCVSTISKSPVGFHEVDINIDKLVYCSPSQVITWDAVGDGQVYDWNLNGSVSSMGDSVIFNLSDSGYLSLGVDIVFASGCTTSIAEDSIAFMADPSADFDLVSVAGECAPKTVEFEDRSSAGVVSYYWDFGNATGSSLPNPIAVYSESGVYTVSLRITDSLNCKDTVVYEDLLKLQGPKALFEADAQEICEGEEVAFDNQSQGSVSYLWVFGDGNSSTALSGQNQYMDSGLFTVDLFAFDSLGCRDRERLEFIEVNLTPVPKFLLKQTDKCVPAVFVLEDQSERLEDPEYIVAFGQDQIGVTPGIPFEYDQVGDHDSRVIIENNNGCKASKVVNRTVQVFDTVAGPSPVLHQLSVQNNYTQILFELEPSHNFENLVLIKPSASSWDTLDISTDSTFLFKDSLPNPDVPNCYRVGLEHTCVASLPVSSLEEYCTIDLNVISTESHERRLSWNPLNDNVSVKGYTIQTRRDDQGFTTIAGVGSEVLEFLDSARACPGEQTYRIIANEVNGHADAQSDREKVLLDTLPVLFQRIDVQYVSVNDNDAIIVEWDPQQAQQTPLVPFYNLRRTGDDDLFHDLSMDIRHGVYIDHKVDPSDVVYKYEIVPVNACGLDLGLGDPGASLVLHKEQQGNEVNLSWRGREELLEDISSFEVQYQDEYGIWKSIEVLDKDKRSTIIDLRDLDLENK